MNQRGRSLFGLAPSGVCPATIIADGAVRSYRTFSPLPRLLPPEPRTSRDPRQVRGAVYFLWHFPLTRLESGPPAVSRQIALWSSDFPPHLFS